MLDRVRPDVVYVVTAPGHLLPIVLDCIERGIHTSVEKSPGMNSDETQQMLVAAQRSAAKVIVSVNRRYMPHALAVKRLVLVRGGAVHCAATYNKTAWPWETMPPGSVVPAPIICDAIHHIDLLRWLAGDHLGEAADAVEVYAERWEGQRHNAVVKFANGRCGVLMSHYGVGFRIQRAEVHAQDFSAYMDLTRGAPQGEQPAGFDLFADGARYEQALDLDAVGGPGFNETRHLVECIEHDRQPWSNLADAMKTMQLCEAIGAGHKGPL
jgi:predicted dehydrogenase